MEEQQSDTQQSTKYTTEDVIKNVNKLLKVAEQEKWNPAVFFHALIFTSEFVMKQYKFVPKEVAEIRRQTKKIIEEIAQQPTKPSP
jgi:hypothetical protein